MKAYTLIAVFIIRSLKDGTCYVNIYGGWDTTRQPSGWCPLKCPLNNLRTIQPTFTKIHGPIAYVQSKIGILYRVTDVKIKVNAVIFYPARQCLS